MKALCAKCYVLKERQLQNPEEESICNWYYDKIHGMIFIFSYLYFEQLHALAPSAISSAMYLSQSS
jgi:hypothetical protein